MKPFKNVDGCSYNQLQRALLKVVVAHQDWMIKNPTALQWLMVQWTSVFYGGRFCYGYHGIIKKGKSCEWSQRDEIEHLRFKNGKIHEFIEQAFINAWDCVGDSETPEDHLYSREEFDEWRQNYPPLKGEVGKPKFRGWQQHDIASFPVPCQELLAQVIYSPRVQTAIKTAATYIKQRLLDKRRSELPYELLSKKHSKEKLDAMPDAEYRQLVKVFHKDFMKAFGGIKKLKLWA